jgi:signal peptidase I
MTAPDGRRREARPRRSGAPSGTSSYDIPTGSMAPTIQPHDRIIANRFIYRLRDIHRGDIIVFSPTLSAKRTCQESLDGPWVKRVIGLPGDRVRVVAGGPTLVNGRPISVPNARPNPVSMSWPPVPDGRLLVLGDNRPNSCDAHLWKPDAFVPESSVIGQAEVIYWPPQHVGFLD